MIETNENLLNKRAPIYSLDKDSNEIITFPNGMKVLITIDSKTKERIETVLDCGREEI